MKPILQTRLAYAVPVWWLLVATLILAGCVSSTYASLAVNILAIVIFPVVFLPAVFDSLRRDPFVLLFVGAFFLLGAVFSVSAQSAAEMLQWFNYLPLLLCVPVYMIARDISNERTITIVLSLLLAGAVIACGVGYYDLVVRGVGRAEGYLTGAIIYGRLALMLGFLAGTGLFVLKSRWRYLFVLGPAPGILATLMSVSRGIMLIIPFLGVIYLVFCLYGQRRRVWLMAIAGAALVCFLTALAASMLTDTSRLVESVQQVLRVLSGGEGVDSNTGQRLVFYSLGWNLFWQSPWVGYGGAAIPRTVFTILDPADYDGIYSRNFFHFHNDIIQSAVAGGIFGLLALLAVLAAPLAGALKAATTSAYAKPLLFGALGLSTIQFLSGLTDITFGYDMPTTAYAMLVAVMLGLFGPRFSFRPCVF